MEARRSHAIVLTVAALLAAGAATPATARADTDKAPTTRYADPNGTVNATCRAAKPCDLVTAINNAPSGSTIIIKPGTYAAAKPLTTTLTDTTRLLTIEGKPGAAMPVIHSAASTAVSLGRSSLTHVKIVSTTTGVGLAVGAGSANHVDVEVSGTGAAACAIDAHLTDSLCLATGTNATALQLDRSDATGVATDLTVRGVTAEATAPTGVGLAADADGESAVTVNATNDIFHGGATDVSAATGSAIATAHIVLRNCAYMTTTSDGDSGLKPAAATVAGDATDVHVAPTFLSAAGGNFAEAAGSATIDAGTGDTGSDTDLAGNPRLLGSAADIGAYEFLALPVIKKLAIGNVAAHTARLVVTVNPEGLSTSVTLIATAGKQKINARADAGSGRKAVKVTISLTGLTASTPYTVVAKATNAGGHVTSAKKAVKTPKGQ